MEYLNLLSEQFGYASLYHYHFVLESVCCLLVLDSVTSTPQWIRQPKPRDGVRDVCEFVSKWVLGSSRASQPLNVRFLIHYFKPGQFRVLESFPLRLFLNSLLHTSRNLLALECSDRDFEKSAGYLWFSERPPCGHTVTLMF